MINTLHAVHGDFTAVVKKGDEKKVAAMPSLPESVAAPVKEGDVVGGIDFTLDGSSLGSIPITAAHGVEKISFGGLLGRMLRRFFLT